MNSHDPNDTQVEIKAATSVPPPPVSQWIPTTRVDLAGQSETGAVRKNNEDHYLVVKFGRFLRVLESNLQDDSVPESFEQQGIGIGVADGMGGRSAGEVASRIAISKLIELVLETPDWIMSGADPHLDEVQRRTEERFAEVDAAIRRHADGSPGLHGMGTTMTVAISFGADLLIAYVGDSRAYLLRRGQLIRLTCDQTYAQQLADAGLIPFNAVATHRMRHVLTSALGGECDARTDFHRMRLAHGDALLLCTDGLTEMVGDAAIERTLATAADAKSAGQSLVRQALEAGGHDNVTVVVARYAFE